MDMEGVIVRNRYYRDSGSDYVVARLVQELTALGLKIETTDAFSLLSRSSFPKFAVFLDKDYTYARLLEQKGVRLYNRADAIRICDDKCLTAVELDGVANFPDTICAPLNYPVSDPHDELFLKAVSEKLGFPLIAKFCIGSLGAQVFLINSGDELSAFHMKNVKRGRIIYQRYVDESRGRDIRIYTVDGKAIASVSRENNSSFKSNAERGGRTEAIEPSKAHIEIAEKVSKKLGLDYAAVDFFKMKEPLIAEVNSNAYFKDAEAASGVNIAACYAKHIAKESGC